MIRQHILEIYDIVDRNSNRRTLITSGILLTLLVGVISPAMALILDITSVKSLIFLFISACIYGLFIIANRCMSAGIIAAAPTLVFYNIAYPFTPEVGSSRVELFMSDFVIIPLGIFGLYFVYRKSKPLLSSFLVLMGIFALWALVIGLINYVKGYPVSGVYFGVNQWRYLLVAAAAVVIVDRYDLSSLLNLLLIGASLQIIVAIAQSIYGKSFGLVYFGDMTVAIDVGKIFVFHTGLFPGAFVGSSRALVAILILLFAPATAWWFKEDVLRIPALICILGTPFVIIASRSIAGAGTLAVSILLLLAAHLNPRKYRVSARMIGSITVLAVGTGYVIGGVIIGSGVFDHSSTRAGQYLAAISTAGENPIGIGGGNFHALAEDGLPPAYSAAESAHGVHNTFLGYLLELGWFGLIIHMILISIPYSAAILNYASNSANKWVFAGTVAIGMISFHSISSLTWIYQRPNVMMVFWLIATGAILEFTDQNRLKSIFSTMSDRFDFSI